MQIVYDITQTRDKGLAGWPDPLPVFSRHGELPPLEQALWSRLAPEQKPCWGQAAVTTDLMRFWDQLLLVGEAGQSQYDILRNSNLESNQRLACVALSGQGFHGQRGRPWQALAGNLHLSISVPLSLPAGPRALAWTMLPAVAVMRALKCLEMPNNELCGIKWVNDVLWGTQKLGGVISSLVIADGKIHRGLLGIGLNVAKAPELTTGTCCLNEHSAAGPLPLGRVLQVVLACVADLINQMENGGDEEIFPEYQHHCLVVGRLVRIMTDPVDGVPVEICRGKVLGIKPDLGLVMEGRKDPVRDGRLYLL